MNNDKQYADRDIMGLDLKGGYYFRHVDAMTGESLHSKSDIAAELGHRDMLIDTYRELCGELLKQLKSAADIDCPLIGSPTIADLIDFWQHEKNEGRGIAQDMLDIYEAITKAEKLLGENNAT